MTDTAGIPGQQSLTDANSTFNHNAFQIEQALGQVGTIRLAKVMKVKLPGANGDVAQAGTLDVMPLTNQVDGQGNAIPHGTIHSIPYSRAQNGGNAIIMDHKEGDIVVLGVADRDISANIKKRGQANPGSKRRFDLADSIVLGSILNKAPDQFIRFTDDGLEIGDKNGNRITMKAGSIAITTTLLTVNGGIVAGFGTGDSVTVQHHKHGGGPVPDPGT